MDRVLRAATATISDDWDEGLARGTVTLGITASDGTVVVAAGTATDGTGTDRRTFDLTAAHTADLDLLTVTWTSDTLGALVTRVEVAGGYLFSLATLDALLDDPTDYTTEQKQTARLRAEARIERVVGAALVPRYSYETLSGDSTPYDDLKVAWPYVRDIRSVTIDGEAETDLTVYTGLPHGFIHSDDGWDSGSANIVIGYEHGLDFPPPEISDAAALLAKHYLIKGPIDDRATALSAGPDGGTISLLTPGVRGIHFGIPEVDEVVEEARATIGVR